MTLRHLLGSDSGASAAEFALVLPLLMVFLLGMVDVGRIMLEWNRAEKATQMGARFAVATDLVPSALFTYSFASQGGIPQGDAVPSSAFPGVRCAASAGSVSCTCKPGGTCSFALSANASAFGRIVDRMKASKADIASANVVVDYDHSGLGFAGDPNGPDVSPLVTVSLRSLTFSPLIFFGRRVNLPSFSTTLSLEDGEGSRSN